MPVKPHTPHLDKIRGKKKVRPPFPKLPSFFGAATVLSYVGHQGNIKQLLNLLNKNTQKFLLYHRDILREFVKILPPTFTGELHFGIQSTDYDCEYPTEEQL